jgi:hypothetical protein
MLSGSLLKLPADLDIARLNRLVWAREYNGRTLRSVIQFEGPPIRLLDMSVQQALAIHEHRVMQPVLEENNGIYSINYEDAIVPIWARCYFISELGIVDKLYYRSFVADIINHGLRLIVPTHDVAIDTARMWRDHRGHWVRAFDKRQGRVDRGIVYGDSVEQDSVFGPELERANCQSIGWTSDSFGDPVKVRVSPKGSVIVWADIPPEVFIRFIRQEILPYATHF